MARTYTATTFSLDPEEYTYTVYAKYVLDTYRDGDLLYWQKNNMQRNASVRPVGDGTWEVQFNDRDESGEWVGTVPVALGNERDARLLAKAWVVR